MILTFEFEICRGFGASTSYYVDITPDRTLIVRQPKGDDSGGQVELESQNFEFWDAFTRAFTEAKKAQTEHK